MASRTRIFLLTSGSFCFFIANYATNWPLLHYWNVSSGVFGDTRSVLRSSECFKQVGLLIYDMKSEDLSCSGFWYGQSILRLLNILHLDTRDTTVLGVIFLLLLSFSISALIAECAPSDCFALFLQVFLLSTPPILLLAQRANFDTLILFELVVATILLGKHQYTFAQIILACTAIMKFYTLPLLIIPYLYAKSVKSRLTIFLIAVATLAFVIHDLLRSKVYSSMGSFTGQSFGIGTLVGSINLTSTLSISSKLARVSDMLIFSILLLLIGALRRRRIVLVRFETANLKASASFLVFAGVLLSSFLIGSVDYRLIYLIFVGGLLYKFGNLPNSHLMALVLLISNSLLFSYPSGRSNIFGDFSVFLFCAYSLHVGISIVIQQQSIRRFFRIKDSKTLL